MPAVKCMVAVIMASYALSAAEAGRGNACKTLSPARAAIESRMAARGVASPFLRAAVRAESALDVVDVLVAYDLSAQRWLAENGRGTPQEHARAKVDEMNECLAASLVDKFRFRLVGTVCMDEDATECRDVNGDVDYEAILTTKLVDEWGEVVATGEWAKITDARERLGADVVSVAIDSGPYGIIGLGYALDAGTPKMYAIDPSRIVAFGDWAYSVFSICVADESLSMLHEISHAMGCGHPDAPYAASSAMDLGPQLYGYSAGFYAWIDGEGYCTVMGYNFGGLRPDGSYDPEDRFTMLPYFSSPLLSYKGVPLGTDMNDNRRTLLDTCAYVAQYRAAKTPPDGDGGSGEDPEESVFQTEFRPLKTINGAAPYVGVVVGADKPAGVISLKCTKVASNGKNAGASKVSATVTGLDGKKRKSSAVYVACGRDAEARLEVRDWGSLSLKLGGEGFAGTLGDGMSVRTAAVGGILPHERYAVAVDFGTASLPHGTLRHLLPTENRAEQFSAKHGKWSFAKAASIKYAKIKDRASGAVSYELQGADNPAKPNLSAMKISYAAKTGTFKGAFKIYALVQTGKRTRLKKYTAKVSGIFVDGTGYGIAVLKGSAAFPVTVSPQTE